MEEKRKILLLVGMIPPYTCEDGFSEKMQEFYLLKAKDSLPDLKWEIKELTDNKSLSTFPKEKRHNSRNNQSADEEHYTHSDGILDKGKAD